jgi:hypothetical protein
MCWVIAPLSLLDLLAFGTTMSTAAQIARYFHTRRYAIISKCGSKSLTLDGESTHLRLVLESLGHRLGTGHSPRQVAEFAEPAEPALPAADWRCALTAACSPVRSHTLAQRGLKNQKIIPLLTYLT